MNYTWVKKYIALACAGVLGASMLLAGCGEAKEEAASASVEEASSAAEEETPAEETEAVSEAETEAPADDAQAEEATTEDSEKLAQAPEIPGLTCESVMDLEYAESFDVYYYNDGYKVIDVKEDRPYLIVPEDGEEPDDLDDNMVVLQQPLDNIYMAASAVMALFDSMDGLDSIRMSGTQENGWFVENAAKAMKDGKILFGGKYDKPDYEMLVAEGCSLAIESTMILHSPKVQEMIEDLGIPVFTDYSSYESEPLGRTEWIKAYGAMLNHEEQAQAFFNDQMKIIEKLNDFQNTEKTVAYFHINTEGSAVVRTCTDYIPKMIEMAGGLYAFPDMKKSDDSRSASMTISMEQFYSVAKDADYLVYNTSIDTSVNTMKDLLAKDELFKDFKAVKDGNVWSTGRSLYQATDTVGEFILDIHEMLTSGDEGQMRFLTKIK
ncbi:MAG: ABC transporter substrate-binding protein [Lachnospiraceae bacterium]|nr:ABC transporter substrate-binding protein [Lachnospiraceae bacterium]